MGAEKFCLRWNDFETNLSSAFRDLRADNDLFDVTLSCGSDTLQAHKLVLSACSDLFRTMFRRTQPVSGQGQTILYLRGIHSADMQAVLDFMYHGEVSVAQEELNSFLSVAEDLKVKGLTQKQADSSTNRKVQEYPERKATEQNTDNTSYSSFDQKRSKPEFIAPNPSVQTKPRPRPSKPSLTAPPPPDPEIEELVPVKTEPVHQAPVYQQVATMDHIETVQEDQAVEAYDGYAGYEDDGYQYQEDGGHYTDGQVALDTSRAAFKDPEELLQFLTKDDQLNHYTCTLCLKTIKQRKDARNHVESIHFPNTFVYSCTVCDKTFNSKNTRNVHITRIHNKKNTSIENFQHSIEQF